MDPDTLRDAVTYGDFVGGGDDLAGFLFGLGFMLFVVIAAPVIVVMLAGFLLAFELPILIVLALALVAARLFGVIPWTIGIVDPQTGTEQHERTRNLIRAVRRVREVNDAKRVPVRWSWS